MINQRILKIVLNKYLVEVETFSNKYYPSYKGSRFTIYNLKNKEILHTGGCSFTISPEELIDKIIERLWCNENL